ncbi:MAG: hypothetical protein F6J92_16250 [Symploca sp. SIO1A3]|nr:hypothetical protein [Symploca sp. SIO1A3]
MRRKKISYKHQLIPNPVKTQDIHLPPKSPNSDTGGEIHVCLQNGELGELRKLRENNDIVGVLN